jgi:hypothetical protein
MRRITVFALLSLALASSAQNPEVSALSTEPLTVDQFAIYQDFLTNFGVASEGPGDLLNMQPQTVAFDPAGSRGCAMSRGLNKPAATHTLPPAILAFSDPARIERILAANHTLVPAEKRGPHARPDGYVETKFRLSEIAFDASGTHAAFTWSASCNCKGGEGRTVLYEKIDGHWRQSSKLCDGWEG